MILLIMCRKQKNNLILFSLKSSKQLDEEMNVLLYNVVDLLLPGGTLYWILRHPRCKMYNNRPEKIVENITKKVLPLDFLEQF